MFRFRSKSRPGAGARHHLRRSSRARTSVEELEPRTLLTSAPVALVLPPMPSMFQITGHVQLPAVAPVQPGGTFTAVQVTVITTVPAAAATVAQPVSSGNAAGNAGTSAVLTNPITTPGAFATVPPGTNQASPQATLNGTQTSQQLAIERFLLLFERAPETVRLPFVLPFLRQGPVTPSPGQPATEPVINTPSYFNPATHRLLFVVGGPEDPSPEDYLNEYEDGRVLPTPGEPPLASNDSARPEIVETHVQQPAQADLLQPVEQTQDWHLVCEQLFAGEFATDESDPVEVPALGTAENTRAEAVRLEENEEHAARPELLAAVAAIGLLNGTRWQKEGPRDGEARLGQRRPAVLLG